VVADVVDHDPGLLLDLAGDRVLQAFARLDEAGQGRMHAGRELRLPAEQAAVATMHQHDDGGVGAGEMAGAAGGVGAAPLMSRLARHGRAAADAAEAMAGVPVQDAAGEGEHAAFRMAQRGADAAQVEEVAELGDAGQFQRPLDGGQVDREVGDAAVGAEQGDRGTGRDLLAQRTGRQPAGRRLIAAGDEVLRPPDGLHPRPGSASRSPARHRGEGG
jgi:hypothetical protein